MDRRPSFMISMRGEIMTFWHLDFILTLLICLEVHAKQQSNKRKEYQHPKSEKCISEDLSQNDKTSLYKKISLVGTLKDIITFYAPEFQYNTQIRSRKRRTGWWQISALLQQIKEYSRKYLMSFITFRYISQIVDCNPS